MKANKSKRIHILFLLFLLILCVLIFQDQLYRISEPFIQKIRGQKTVADRLEQYGDIVRKRLSDDFQQLGISYPPKKMVFIAIKQQKLLEVWVSENSQDYHFLKSYPILGASGKLGPKLKEGDLQVPEGIYKIESLNPNSRYHLALRINYPNEFDRVKGKLDGRDNLGGDIMIHGKSCSIGCLAMGDSAVEDLFVLAAETGLGNISVILIPVDFREVELPEDMPQIPDWIEECYEKIHLELNQFRK